MKSVQSFIHKREFFSKSQWRYLPLLFSFLVLFACSGGGIGGSGVSAGPAVGGSGTGDISIISVGPITALGSIVVNGIEFETTVATVTTAGVNSDARDLQVGMVVKLEGILHADGKTGKANVVAFSPNAVGPITGIDLSKGSLEVMGQTVLVDPQTMIAGLPGNSPGLADLATDDLVEISGLLDVDGNIRATRIARKTVSLTPQVSGRVSSLTGATFNINALTVDFSSAILSKFGSGGIQPGDFVEVKGDLTSPIALLVDTIEKKIPDFKDGPIEIEGFIDSLLYAGQSISGFAMITPFGLQGIELFPSTVFSGGQLDQVKAGTRVKVEGVILNNMMWAMKLVLF